MTLKTCTCGKKQTTRNAVFVARKPFFDEDLMYFNCTDCGSTFVLRGTKKIIEPNLKQAYEEKSL